MLENKNLVKLSRFLSLVLRHKPETIDITLDDNGWCNVDELIKKINNHGEALGFELLKEIVETNDKQRFKFNDNYTKIRASQGHSIEVNLNLSQVEPPEILFHGTPTKNIVLIKKNGLLKMKRNHVHLSESIETARTVGERRGKTSVLTIDSKQMYEDGILFYKSDNNVWLTDFVNPKYIYFEHTIF